MPAREEPPSTLARPPDGARRTWIKAHDSAAEQYAEGEGRKGGVQCAQAHLRDGRRPLGARGEPAQGSVRPEGRPPRGQGGRSGEGVDEQAAEARPYEVARRLDVPGRFRMTRRELPVAIRKANRSRSRKARSRAAPGRAGRNPV